MKSDNADGYSGNGHIQLEIQTFKKYGMKLLRHDYKEPQLGEDQCDRETANAQHCRTAYLSSGKNISNASELKESLLYMGGVRNFKVSVIEINNSNIHCTFQIIQNISTYHSAEATYTRLKVWPWERYFPK
ncbi:hypothetical protein AVEN_140057-1 [Araneus ventricosus]|uniref:Uncharacterized protein n=1 Tax=Araneus ventricosus TaxID=182803 RepID=A0A4Y2VBG4_ARAVE|nr:hypothetical protein AVEN_170897-1 [Araneus ventricosus]GBO22603.1 hypothetical protein AVEN_111193-1 [Araneus ventricosus]GBO22604.1 hypothetical protein AVEN_140057-1 [Araneus ventricosus]